MRNVDLQNILTQHNGDADVVIGAVPSDKSETDVLVREILVDGQVVGQIEVRSTEGE